MSNKMEVKPNKTFVKVALKMMGRRKRETLAKLSKEEFVEKIKSNNKSKKISDDMVDLMYEELKKKVGNKNDR